ncbi:MAG: SLC13 family permease [Megasphaera sp.]|uniref:SLC13 family permease n=1 Tax=Megasphaera sp. TaxID=2023260 RepID=UPI003F04F4E4
MSLKETGTRQHIKSAGQVIKENLVLFLAVAAAMVSMTAVPPSASYAGYINMPVLAILFCLMVVIGGVRESGVFSAVLARLLLRLGTMRQLAAVLVFACFFVSMWVTNDVALLTFVPFSLMALPKVASEEQMAFVIVLQTLAANLGSMCTPVGNPQNLYLYFYYGMNLSSFLTLLLPYTLVAFLLLALSLFRLPGTPIPISVRLAARRTRNLPVLAPSRQLWLLGGMFFLSLLTVAHVLDYRLTLALVVGVTALTRPQYFRYADYRLLGTFVAFFILVGNMSQLPEFRDLLTGYLEGHEFLIALLASQIISNVPAAVLLSGFTDEASALLLGTDIGGLGTLIASMASLISYGMYVRSCPRQQGKYLKLFTLLNLAYLLVLVLFAWLLAL